MARTLLTRSLQPLALALAGAAGLAALNLPAMAQRVVPKIGSICPLGYVDTFNGRCSSLGVKYTVFPKGNGDCPKGAMDIGGGYCRKL